MTLRFQFFSGLFIIFQGSGKLLVFYPLVADKLEAAVCFGLGQIGIGRIDETGGQAVLLLEGSISQSSVGSILGQILGGFSTQGGIEVLTGLVHRCAYILYHGTDSLHIFKYGRELGDAAGHFFRHICQGTELLGTGLHNQVSGDQSVFVPFVAKEEFLHVAGCFFGGLAGEAGRFGYIAAGLVCIDRPIEHLGGNKPENAHGNNRDDDDEEAFLLFHRATDFFFLELLIHSLQK